MAPTIPAKDPINLLRGWPNPSLLPVSSLSTASSTALSTPSVYNPGLVYGPDEGYHPLRRHIAEWLTSFYQPRDPISENRICITGGASQNLACALQVFTDPVYTRHVWMVAPTYHLAGRTMDDAGFAGRLRGVLEDEEGVDVGFLRRGLEEAERRAVEEGNFVPKHKPPRPWRKIYKHIIYATPTFSNPSMKIMSLRRREDLVRLAREYDALIIADDVYDFLQWSSIPDTAIAQPGKACIPRLVDVDRYLDGGPKDEWGNVMSNGSFSKLVAPGVRTGWAEGTEKFAYGLSQTGSSRSGGAPSHLTATFIDQLLLPSRSTSTSESVLQTHILNVLQPAYADRYHRTISAVRKYLLPLGVTLSLPLPHPPNSQEAKEVAGGYFIWIHLPHPLRASDIAARALREENLTVAEGDLFRVPGDPVQDPGSFGRCIRLCFAWEEPGKLVEGVCRLGGVVARALGDCE